MGKEAETRGDEKRRDGTRKEKRWERHLVNWIRTTLLWAFVKKRQDGAGRGKARWDITLDITLDFFTLEGEEQKRLDTTRWDEMRQEKRQDEKWLCLMMKKNDWGQVRQNETGWDETLSILQEETIKDKKELTETRREIRNYIDW